MNYNNLSGKLLHFFNSINLSINKFFMPTFPAFVIKIKINVSANLTYFVWVKCQFSTNFNHKS
jgi:hypothetical protein